MKPTITTLFGLLSCVILAVGAPTANALPISVSGGAFVPGSGYGVDTGGGNSAENSGTLLDVLFSASLASQDFTLANIGDSFTFSLGSISFRELDAGNGANRGIRPDELDQLGVTTTLNFTGGFAEILALTGSGTAITGIVGDSGTDFTLHWDPAALAFGNGGLLDIRLDDLVYSSQQVQTQTATVTLRNLPDLPTGIVTNAVPEPASLALFMLGLIGIGLICRQRPGDTARAKALP